MLVAMLKSPACLIASMVSQHDQRRCGSRPCGHKLRAHKPRHACGFKPARTALTPEEAMSSTANLHHTTRDTRAWRRIGLRVFRRTGPLDRAALELSKADRPLDIISVAVWSTT
jgi:hypothetical protein